MAHRSVLAANGDTFNVGVAASISGEGERPLSSAGPGGGLLAGTASYAGSWRSPGMRETNEKFEDMLYKMSLYTNKSGTNHVFYSILACCIVGLAPNEPLRRSGRLRGVRSCQPESKLPDRTAEARAPSTSWLINTTVPNYMHAPLLPRVLPQSGFIVRLCRLLLRGAVDRAAAPPPLRPRARLPHRRGRAGEPPDRAAPSLLGGGYCRRGRDARLLAAAPQADCVLLLQHLLRRRGGGR